MRVRRVIEYDGDEKWLTRTLNRSISGVCECGTEQDNPNKSCTITEVSREVIEDAGREETDSRTDDT